MKEHPGVGQEHDHLDDRQQRQEADCQPVGEHDQGDDGERDRQLDGRPVASHSRIGDRQHVEDQARDRERQVEEVADRPDDPVQPGRPEPGRLADELVEAAAGRDSLAVPPPDVEHRQKADGADQRDQPSRADRRPADRIRPVQRHQCQRPPHARHREPGHDVGGSGRPGAEVVTGPRYRSRSALDDVRSGPREFPINHLSPAAAAGARTAAAGTAVNVRDAGWIAWFHIPRPSGHGCRPCEPGHTPRGHYDGDMNVAQTRSDAAQTARRRPALGRRVAGRRFGSSISTARSRTRST